MDPIDYITPPFSQMSECPRHKYPPYHTTRSVVDLWLENPLVHLLPTFLLLFCTKKFNEVDQNYLAIATKASLAS